MHCCTSLKLIDKALLALQVDGFKNVGVSALGEPSKEQAPITIKDASVKRW